MSKAHAANGKVSKLGCLATCLNQALLQCMKSRAASQRQRKLIEAI
jgi:hypothetical protein